jgi:hypothetical protein
MRLEHIVPKLTVSLFLFIRSKRMQKMEPLTIPFRAFLNMLLRNKNSKFKMTIRALR